MVSNLHNYTGRLCKDMHKVTGVQEASSRQWRVYDVCMDYVAIKPDPWMRGDGRMEEGIVQGVTDEGKEQRQESTQHV